MNANSDKRNVLLSRGELMKFLRLEDKSYVTQWNVINKLSRFGAEPLPCSNGRWELNEVMSALREARRRGAGFRKKHKRSTQSGKKRQSTLAGK